MEGIVPPSMRWDDSNLPEAFEKFVRHSNLVFSGPLASKSEKEKVSYLLLWLGDKGRDIRHSWTDITEEDAEKLDTFYERFRNYLRPTLNPIFARYQFFNEVQKDETIDSFVTRLRLKAKDCNFSNLDEMLRDRIVFGTNSNKIREKLINQGKDLTLERAIQICQNYEYSREQMKEMGRDDVHAVSKRDSRHRTSVARAEVTQYKPKQPNNAKPKKKADSDRKCGKCGYKHTDRECPAKGKKCDKCGKLNHFKSVCRSKTVNQISANKDYDSSSSSDADFYVNTVNTLLSHNDQAFATLNVGPNTTQISFKIDTGSQVNILPESKFQLLGIKCPLEPSSAKLSSDTGNSLKVKGTIRLQATCRHKSIPVTFYVVETTSSPLLSLQASTDLNLIKIIYSLDSQEISPETGHKTPLFKEYKSVFDGIGLMPGEVKLHLRPECVPVVNPPRRVPVALKDKLREELDRMEKLDIIDKVTSPTDWVNNLVIVKKPKTKKLRVCLDPKALNEALCRPHYPMRTFEEVTSQLAGAKYFSLLDATSGYFSVKLDETSSYCTTFNTPFGRYRFKRLPFGLICSQDIFQQKLDEAFERLPGVTGIVVDNLVYGQTKDEHDLNLRQVLQRAQACGVKFNPENV